MKTRRSAVAVEFQDAFNLAVGLVGTLAGFVLKAMWDGLKELQHADKELTDKVHGIEKVVAGDYVKKDELERAMQALFMKLDRIEHKLDGKADKV